MSAVAQGFGYVCLAVLALGLLFIGIGFVQLAWDWLKGKWEIRNK